MKQANTTTETTERRGRPVNDNDAPCPPFQRLGDVMAKVLGKAAEAMRERQS